MRPIARIRLLGQFEISPDGETAPPLESARAESLLAYLLLHRDTPHSRQRLAFLFWPDSTEAQARTNLRHVLHTLRGRQPVLSQLLEITPRIVRWRTDAPYWLDVGEFEQLLATEGSDGRGEALRAAVALYTGDLLEGRYDDWLLSERDRLRHHYLDALAELAGLCEARGEVAEAISHTERLLRGDPLREEAYRQLMRLHAVRGDRARAVGVYHVCAATLERELGVAPCAATREVYEGLLPPEPERPAAPRAARVDPPLVGRAPQWARLMAAWRATIAGRAQFALLSGEPGVGKTRLAEDFRAWCTRRGAVTAHARCYPAEGPLAYGPVVSWLRCEALRPLLPRLGGLRLTEIARLLPELLLEMPELERPAPLPESEQRHRLFDAVSAALLPSGGPALLVVDDLQHGDRETCQLLHYLLRVAPHAQVLVVATARREEIDGDHPVHELGITVVARLAPPLPFLPPEQYGRPILGLLLVWAGELAEGQRAIAPLRRLSTPLADVLRPVPYLAIQSMLDGAAAHGMHYYWKSHRLSGLTREVIDVVMGGVETITSPMSQLSGWVIGGAVSRVDAGETAVGERENGFELNITAAWPPSDRDGEHHRTWVRKHWEVLRPASVGVYTNFLSDEDAVGVAQAYGSRLARLTSLKDRYDPANFFRLNANVQPSGGSR